MIIQNLLLKATELGLAACPIAGFRGKQFLRKTLSIPSRYDTPLLVLIGEPGKEEYYRPYRVSSKKIYSKKHVHGIRTISPHFRYPRLEPSRD
ncbi:MAG: hypothetical protein HC945_03565 [Nitrosarchaeum sp.]|nr:hypothetical protein [Nitrosarchaeum sp.]